MTSWKQAIAAFYEEIRRKQGNTGETGRMPVLRGKADLFRRAIAIEAPEINTSPADSPKPFRDLRFNKVAIICLVFGEIDAMADTLFLC